MFKRLSKYYVFLLAVSFVFTNVSSAQTCGFGCLGLSGFYGGFTFQNYKGDGLTEYLLKTDGSSGSVAIPEFKQVQGFRVGANFFRAKFDNFFISAKGFYQFLDEEHEVIISTVNNTSKHQYTLKLDNWGFGVDFGIPLFNIIDWKIIEGGVNIFNTSFIHEDFENGDKIQEQKFENTKNDVGYYVASGLIINIIKDYVSIEGSAMYNFFRVKELKTDDGLQLPGAGKNNFIESGGFAASVQLNLGFPL